MTSLGWGVTLEGDAPDEHRTWDVTFVQSVSDPDVMAAHEQEMTELLADGTVTERGPETAVYDGVTLDELGVLLSEDPAVVGDVLTAVVRARQRS